MELDKEVKNVLDEEEEDVSQWWRQLKTAIDIKVIADTSLLVGNDTIGFNFISLQCQLATRI